MQRDKPGSLHYERHWACWVGRREAILRRSSGGPLKNTHIEMFAMQIVQLKPDVILSNGTPATISFQQQTKDIPVVFTMVTDPVGQGLVKSLAQPGANLTGFTNFEFSMGGKWLGLLKEVSPKVAHVAVLYIRIRPHTLHPSSSRCKQAQRHRPFKFSPLKSRTLPTWSA